MPNVLHKKFNYFLSICFFIGLGVTIRVYWPGLKGYFIFDDYPNLSTLGSYGGVNSFETLKKYIFSGFAGPTGRPVALLSFLINANDWPADPYSFKYTNLLIHALNGVLLFWVTLRILCFLERRNEPSKAAKGAALTAALAWLLHPYLVSTTLYVVQRMAQLSLLFGLAGTLSWLHGRRIISDHPVRAYIWMTLGVCLGGGLAFLSKENGALWPLLIFCIESTVIRSSGAKELNTWWRRFVFLLPALFIGGYLIYIGFSNGWTTNYGTRDFSPIERLLTQPRVLFTYLYHWFIPHLFTTGVYHDAFEISRGIFTPLTTLFAILGTVALIAVAVYYKNQKPLLSLAILFFYVSQLIESTTVGLEIMFEHRVYSASIFLFLPIFYWIWKTISIKKVFVISISFLSLLALFCWRGSSLWGDYPTMIAVWAAKSPTSPRAQVELAKLYYDSGFPEESLEVLDKAAETIPDSFYVKMTRALIYCREHRLDKGQKDDLFLVAENESYSPNWFNLLQKSIDWVSGDNCSGFEIRDLITITDIFLSDSKNRDAKSLGFEQLTYIKGISELLIGDEEAAKKTLRASIESRVHVQKLMNIAAHFASCGHFDEAYLYAIRARERLASGVVRGKELAEAPRLYDIDLFIETVVRDKLDNEKNQCCSACEKRG